MTSVAAGKCLVAPLMTLRQGGGIGPPKDALILEGLLHAKGASRKRNATRHMACIRPCEKAQGQSQSQGQVKLKHKR